MGEIIRLNDDMDIIQKLSDRPNQAETDELSPEEFKAKFDEAANIIKRYINEKLIPDIVAGNIPFASTSGNVTGSTVAEAIEWLKSQVAVTQLGQIGDGTITEDKLTDDVKRILNSGIPVVSAEVPNGNYPIGQIWLKVDAEGAMETIYIKASASEWIPYAFDVLPVNSGGTGLAEYEAGSLLYGKNGVLEKLPAPAGDSFLRFGVAPEWMPEKEMKPRLGFLTVATGTYKGNGKERKIVLVPGGDGTETEDNESAISPVFICVYSKDVNLAIADSSSAESSVCICNGALAHTIRTVSGSRDICVVGLSGNKLILENKGDAGKTTFMNYENYNYGWTALY